MRFHLGAVARIETAKTRALPHLEAAEMITRHQVNPQVHDETVTETMMTTTIDTTGLIPRAAAAAAAVAETRTDPEMMTIDVLRAAAVDGAVDLRRGNPSEATSAKRKRTERDQETTIGTEKAKGTEITAAATGIVHDCVKL